MVARPGAARDRIAMPQRFFKWSPRVQVIRALGMVHDLAGAALVLPLAYLLRLGYLPDFDGRSAVMGATMLVASGLAFAFFRLNQGSWRYASIEDLLAIGKSALTIHVTLVLLVFVLGWMDGLPRSVPLISAGLMVLLLGGNRLAYRLLKEWRNRAAIGDGFDVDAAVIVGYGDETDAFIRNLRRLKNPPYAVAGIIDHAERHVGRRLHGVPVVGSLADLGEYVGRLRGAGRRVSKIIVAPSKVDVAAMRQIVDIASELGVAVFRLPEPSEVMGEGIAELTRPRALRIEDLLGRRHADISLEPVANMLVASTVMVTGAGGSIGSELVRQIATFKPARIVLVDHGEFNLYAIDRDLRASHPHLAVRTVLCDVRDREAVKDVMMAERPAFVFHAAALKHVPLVEANVIEGVRTNIAGTINVADMALAGGARAFVMISTDKAVNPTNVMGATKRFAEAYCQALDVRNAGTKFITVRFGNVLGSAGSVVPLFLKQIEEGGPVTVTHPQMERFFMTISEAVSLVLAASARARERADAAGNIAVLDMGEPMKIIDLAHRMIRLAGLRPDTDIPIVFTGLRPGEKLYEETFDAAEQLEATADRWLQVARPRVVDGQQLADAIRKLEQAAAGRDQTLALTAIRDIVPEFDTAHPALAGMGPPPAPAGAISLSEARSRVRPT